MVVRCHQGAARIARLDDVLVPVGHEGAVVVVEWRVSVLAGDGVADAIPNSALVADDALGTAVALHGASLPVGSSTISNVFAA